MKPPPPVVAVIDIGSNSIKALVATRPQSGQIVALDQQTLDRRISAGISHDDPRLSEDGMALGEQAVIDLLAFIAPHAPQEIKIVATSAVRGAANGSEFAARIKARTGHDLQILSGEEEARLIGQGLLSDPALRTWESFNVFDLGGGSLECLSIENRKLTHATSLPLGCVRLSEKLVANSSESLTSFDTEAIRHYVEHALNAAKIHFINADGRAVFTGGTITTCRAILAEAKNISLYKTSPLVRTEVIAAILKKLGRLPLAERQKIAGLPDRRADVIPVALVTVLALAANGKFHSFQHSFHNLRWGIADALLTPPKTA